MCMRVELGGRLLLLIIITMWEWAVAAFYCLYFTPVSVLLVVVSF